MDKTKKSKDATHDELSPDSASSPKVLSSFDEHGSLFAKDYLKTYYSFSEPTFDEKLLLSFLAKRYPLLPSDSELIEIGCGPTIHHILSAAPYVGSIKLFDYLKGCIDEIDDWMHDREGAHSWEHFTRFVISAEGQDPSAENIIYRENLLKSKISGLGLCDVRQSPVAPSIPIRSASAVACFFTAEQATMATSDMPQNRRMDIWRSIMNNICNCVAPGGTLYMAAVHGSDYYVTYDSQTGGALIHPLPLLLEDDLLSVFAANDFNMERTMVTKESLVGQESEGLTAVMFAEAVRRL